MKTIYSLIIVFAISIATFAQNDTKTSNVYAGGGMGYFIFGTGQFDFKNLNKELWLNGYPEINENFISFGGGGHFQIKRFILGGEGQGFLASKAANDNFSTYGTGGYGFFNFGLAIYQKKRFSSYALLGLGGGGYSIDISENGNADFNNIMAGNFKQIHLTSGGFLMNFSLGTDFFVSGNANDDGVGGISIGLRFGYTLALSNSWSTENQSVSNMPSSQMSGPFIKLLIGGGGFGK